MPLEPFPIKLTNRNNLLSNSEEIKPKDTLLIEIAENEIGSKNRQRSNSNLQREKEHSRVSLEKKMMQTNTTESKGRLNEVLKHMGAVELVNNHIYLLNI